MNYPIGHHFLLLLSKPDVDGASFLSEYATGEGNPAYPNNAYPWPTGLFNDFVLKVTFRPNVTLGAGFPRVVDSSQTNTHGLRVLYDGTRLECRKYNGGVTIRTRQLMTFSAGVEYVLHFRMSSTTGIAHWINGTKAETLDADTSPFTSVGDSYLGSNSIGGNVLDGNVWGLEYWALDDPDISDADTLLI